MLSVRNVLLLFFAPGPSFTFPYHLGMLVRSLFLPPALLLHSHATLVHSVPFFSNRPFLPPQPFAPSPRVPTPLFPSSFSLGKFRSWADTPSSLLLSQKTTWPHEEGGGEGKGVRCSCPASPDSARGAAGQDLDRASPKTSEASRVLCWPPFSHQPRSVTSSHDPHPSQQ